MKKKLALLGAFTLLFSACSSEISNKVVKKYENSLNESIQKEISASNNKNLNIDFKNFTCKADKSYIECNSPDFSFGNDKNSTLFNIKNIKIRSNEIYTENNASGLISYKDYYAHLFAKHDKLESNLNLEGFKLSDELIKTIENESRIVNDEKISTLLKELSQDSYNITYSMLTTKKEQKLNYDSSFKIGNNKENFITTSFLGDVKEEMLTNLDQLNIKFDTNKLTFNTDNLFGNFDKNFELLLANSTLKDFKLDINLQTKDAFAPYINMAKASLEMLQNQSVNEEQNLLYSKVLELINDISKNSLYKLNLALGFKNMPLSEFSTLKENSVEKITINGKDFSDVLKMINQISQMGMMVP